MMQLDPFRQFGPFFFTQTDHIELLHNHPSQLMASSLLGGNLSCHDLGLDVLLALDADLFLDSDEGDAFLGQRVEHGDDLAEGAPEPGELADH